MPTLLRDLLCAFVLGLCSTAWATGRVTEAGLFRLIKQGEQGGWPYLLYGELPVSEEDTEAVLWESMEGTGEPWLVLEAR